MSGAPLSEPQEDWRDTLTVVSYNIDYKATGRTARDLKTYLQFSLESLQASVIMVQASPWKLISRHVSYAARYDQSRKSRGTVILFDPERFTRIDTANIGNGLNLGDNIVIRAQERGIDTSRLDFVLLKMNRPTNDLSYVLAVSFRGKTCRRIPLKQWFCRTPHRQRLATIGELVNIFVSAKLLLEKSVQFRNTLLVIGIDSNVYPPELFRHFLRSWRIQKWLPSETEIYLPAKSKQIRGRETDYILLSSDFIPDSIAEIVPSNGHVVTDHFPVVVDFKLGCFKKRNRSPRPNSRQLFKEAASYLPDKNVKKLLKEISKQKMPRNATEEDRKNSLKDAVETISDKQTLDDLIASMEPYYKTQTSVALSGA